MKISKLQAALPSSFEYRMGVVERLAFSQQELRSRSLSRPRQDCRQKNGRRPRHCARWIGRPTTAYSDSGIPLRVCISSRSNSRSKWCIAMCSLIGKSMSLLWKKMKALFLQTKICEVSQIRINKNPPCLVVNKHLLQVETSNQTWWRKQFGVLFPFSISNFRCGIQWFHWKQTTSFARHIISCNAVAFPNQVVGGRESLLNKGKFLSVHGCSFSRRHIEWQRAQRTSEAFFAFLVVVWFSVGQWFLSWSHSNFCLASVGHWNWTSWYMISQHDLQTFSLGDLVFLLQLLSTALYCHHKCYFHNRGFGFCWITVGCRGFSGWFAKRWRFATVPHPRSAGKDLVGPGPKSRPRYALGERHLGKHLLQQAILCQPSTEMEAFGMPSRPATGATGEACKDAQASFGSWPLEANRCQHRCNFLERRPRGQDGRCSEKVVWHHFAISRNSRNSETVTSLSRSCRTTSHAQGHFVREGSSHVDQESQLHAQVHWEAARGQGPSSWRRVFLVCIFLWLEKQRNCLESTQIYCWSHQIYRICFWHWRAQSETAF